MPTYKVTCTLLIEAETKMQAVNKFCEWTKSFERLEGVDDEVFPLAVELFKEGSLKEEKDEWEPVKLYGTKGLV